MSFCDKILLCVDVSLDPCNCMISQSEPFWPVTFPDTVILLVIISLTLSPARRALDKADAKAEIKPKMANKIMCGI